MAGDVHTISLPGGAKMDLVWVAPGSFQKDIGKGSGNEKTTRKVTLAKGYWIGKSEVTQAQWKSVMRRNPSVHVGDDLPVENVSWNDCMEFIRKVNEEDPYVQLSLPTEAQWEFAARGGTKSKGFPYAGSNSVDAVAWHAGNSGNNLHPVRTKASNELGIHDMFGNVWELCSDWYKDGFDAASSRVVVGPTGADFCLGHVYRGGDFSCAAESCCLESRCGGSADGRAANMGFRIVSSMERMWVGVGKKVGQIRSITLPGGENMEFVWVTPGSFQMGSDKGYDNEKPVRQMTLTKGYWIGRYEVTQAQWKSVMGQKNNPSKFKGGTFPVENVSWNDCMDFINKVNDADLGFRLALPTEAQWEFAACGGKKNKGFWHIGGNDPDQFAWYDENSGIATHPVGTKSYNELGIFDMSGNVWEWCADWYGDYSSGSLLDGLFNSATNPQGPVSGSSRVCRGGDYKNAAADINSTRRNGILPTTRSGNLGFRVVAFSD